MLGFTGSCASKTSNTFLSFLPQIPSLINSKTGDLQIAFAVFVVRVVAIDHSGQDCYNKGNDKKSRNYL